MTCLPFSWVDRQGEGEGGEFGRRERLTRYCWGSRMCKEQSKRMQLKAEEVTSCLNHCGISESLCTDTRLFSFSCCYLFFFLKELICWLIICSESRTQIFIANQLHASRVVSTVIFFCLVICPYGRFSSSKAHFLKLPRGQKVRVMGLADLETISARSNIRKSPDSQAGAGALSSLRQVQGG